jgi:hypothetical protein
MHDNGLKKQRSFGVKSHGPGADKKTPSGEDDVSDGQYVQLYQKAEGSLPFRNSW